MSGGNAAGQAEGERQRNAAHTGESSGNEAWIPVYQPKKIRDPECVEELRKYQADVMVVIAFGQILPKSILEMTPYGCINVHASPSSKVPWCSTDPVGDHQRRKCDRSNDHADG